MSGNSDPSGDPVEVPSAYHDYKSKATMSKAFEDIANHINRTEKASRPLSDEDRETLRQELDKNRGASPLDEQSRQEFREKWGRTNRLPRIPHAAPPRFRVPLSPKDSTSSGTTAGPSSPSEVGRSPSRNIHATTSTATASSPAAVSAPLSTKPALSSPSLLGDPETSFLDILAHLEGTNKSQAQDADPKSPRFMSPTSLDRLVAKIYNEYLRPLLNDPANVSAAGITHSSIEAIARVLYVNYFGPMLKRSEELFLIQQAEMREFRKAITRLAAGETEPFAPSVRLRAEHWDLFKDDIRIRPWPTLQTESQAIPSAQPVLQQPTLYPGLYSEPPHIPQQIQPPIQQATQQAPQHPVPSLSNQPPLMGSPGVLQPLWPAAHRQSGEAETIAGSPIVASTDPRQLREDSAHSGFVQSQNAQAVSPPTNNSAASQVVNSIAIEGPKWNQVAVSKSPRGLLNQGNYCYRNAVYIALAHMPGLLQWFIGKLPACEDYEHCISCCLLISFWQYWSLANTSDGTLSLTTYFGNSNRVINLVTDTLESRFPKQNFRMISHGESIRDVNSQQDTARFLKFLLNELHEDTKRSHLMGNFGELCELKCRGEWQCPSCGTTLGPREITTFGDNIIRFADDTGRKGNQQRYEQCIVDSLLTDTTPYTIDRGCPVCEGTQDRAFELRITKAPVYLILQLVSQTYNPKTEEHVKEPLNVAISLRLNLSAHSLEQNSMEDDMHYRLITTIRHEGATPHYGHYTTVTSAPNGKTYLVNDQIVTEVSRLGLTRSEGNNNPYILIYERCSSEEADRWDAIPIMG